MPAPRCDVTISSSMPSIWFPWQPLLILVNKKRVIPINPVFHYYLAMSFFGRVRFPSYAWWRGGRDFCVSLLDRQVRSHLCIHPDPATVQLVLGVVSVTPTPSTHGYNFRAHHHSILDRNTGVSARFVCLGVHAYYGVRSSNMWWLLD